MKPDSILGKIFVGLFVALVAGIITYKTNKKTDTTACKSRINQMYNDGKDYFSSGENENALKELEEAVKEARKCGVSTQKYTEMISKVKEAQKLETSNKNVYKEPNIHNPSEKSKENTGVKLVEVGSVQSLQISPNNIDPKDEPNIPIRNSLPSNEQEKTRLQANLTRTQEEVQAVISGSKTIFADDYPFEIKHVEVGGEYYHLKNGKVTIFDIPTGTQIFLIDSNDKKHLE